MAKLGHQKSAAIFVLLLLLGASFSALKEGTNLVLAQDRHMKSDVTIYLDPPLLDRGGTVFVIPTEVPIDAWKPRTDLANPARSDWRLDTRKPIGSEDRRLSARISDQISIVRFDYPAGGSYDFRFLPTLESGVAPERQGSVLVSTGNTYDYHPKTGVEVFIPTFQVFTILGPDGDEAAARALVSEVKLGHLEERYRCDEFEAALACSVKDKAK